MYEGGFYEQHKDGECRFRLKEGLEYRGRYELNMECSYGCDYGRRS